MYILFFPLTFKIARALGGMQLLLWRCIYTFNMAAADIREPAVHSRTDIHTHVQHQDQDQDRPRQRQKQKQKQSLLVT